MADSIRERRLSPWSLLGLAWRCGGTTKRRLISATLVVAVSALLTPVIALVMSPPHEQARQAALALVVDFGITTLLLPAVSDGGLSYRYYEALDVTSLPTPREKEYLIELFDSGSPLEKTRRSREMRDGLAPVRF